MEYGDQVSRAASGKAPDVELPNQASENRQVGWESNGEFSPYAINAIKESRRAHGQASFLLSRRGSKLLDRTNPLA